LGNLCVITGHGAKHVEAEGDNTLRALQLEQLSIDYIYNSSYATINNCYSLLLGLGGDEPIIIINADDVFDGRILQTIANKGQTALVIDNVKQLTKESMKVYVENRRISRIGKWLDLETSAGEYIGLARIAAEDIPGLRGALEDVVADNPDGFYEHAFDMMLEKTQMLPAYTDGLKWTEVDTVEDLTIARELIDRGMIQ